MVALFLVTLSSWDSTLCGNHYSLRQMQFSTLLKRARCLHFKWFIAYPNWFNWFVRCHVERPLRSPVKSMVRQFSYRSKVRCELIRMEKKIDNRPNHRYIHHWHDHVAACRHCNRHRSSKIIILDLQLLDAELNRFECCLIINLTNYAPKIEILAEQ